VKRVVALTLLVIICAVSLLGCTSAEEIKKRDMTISQLQTKVTQLEAEVKKLGEQKPKVTATLYFVKSLPTEFYLFPEERQVQGQKPAELMQAALQELIAGPKTPGLQPVLPKDAKVLSVTTDKGLATVNFSAEITRMNVGSRGEALALAAIANTVTKIGIVDRVQVLVDGKKVETLGGHVDASKPIRRSDSLVIFE
jgi:spore germination protein GerM